VTRPVVRLLGREIDKLMHAGLYKHDTVFLSDSREVNFTSYDYLGLSRDQRVWQAAIETLQVEGVGTASTRMLGGTRAVHRELEQQLAQFLGVADATVHGSGYLTNIGLFQTLFDHRDFIFCDAQVHPSLAEGVRLSGARAHSYLNNDLNDLEDKLKRSPSARFRAIVTMGVFPFDGAVADLAGICELGKKYEALIVVDDGLGVGVLGRGGRGSCELRGVVEQVDVVTGSFGKALGGLSGGFAAGREEIIQWLRQKSTTYLFSSPLALPMAAGAQKVLALLASGEAPIELLWQRVATFRQGLEALGLFVLPGEHPTVAVRIGEVVTLQKMVDVLYRGGIYAHGLCYPVVPERQALLRFQLSVLHSEEDLRRTLIALEQIAKQLGVLGTAEQ